VARAWQFTWGTGRAAAALLTATCAGCATEKPGTDRASPAGADDGFPSGPIASPAGTTTTFHVRTEVGPLGSVSYDGQVLPLVSPDGRYLAVEDGEHPDWPILLAQPDAEPPLATRISVYDLSVAPPKRLEFANPLPLGLILGRSVDRTGFLVECPRANDGFRWIGRVSWSTGTLEWLVRQDGINAHGVFTHAGDLLFTRVRPGETRASLVLKRWAGPAGSHADAESVLSDETAAFAFPMVAGEPRLVFALLSGVRSTDLAAIRLVEDPPGSGVHRLGSMVARRSVASSGAPAMAYQVAAPVQMPPPGGAGAEPVGGGPLAIFHPRFGRMAAFDPADSTFIGLAPKSQAAVFWPRAGRAGFFCTTPEGLVFTPLPTADEINSVRPRPPDARVLSTPYVPRLTANPERTLILFGPDSKDSQRLQVFGMRLDSLPLPVR
jgi:hypothetical protein